jgi:hypothetical protein
MLIFNKIELMCAVIHTPLRVVFFSFIFCWHVELSSGCFFFKNNQWIKT